MVWLCNLHNGTWNYFGDFDYKLSAFHYVAPYMRGEDRVLVVTDASKYYVKE